MQFIQKHQKILLTVLACIIAIIAAFSVFFIANNFRIVLNVEKQAELEYGKEETFNLPVATIYGNFLFKNGKALNVNYSIDFQKIGEQDVTYSANYLFYTKTTHQTLTIKDLTPPTIELTYKDGYYTIPGEEYIEEGFTAIDDYDGSLTDKVERTEKDGIVYYSVTDSSGNTAVIEREIVYHDPTPPELTLLGDSKITVMAGGSFPEPGYTATDNIDGDITDKVVTDNTLNMNKPGTYEVKYSVTDSYGNVAEAVRTVTVEVRPQSGTVTPSGKVIYLTFDDGPGPYTKKLLDVLKKYNVKATFFVISTGYNHLLKDIAAAGHSIGIHSTTHKYAQIYASTQAYFNDLYKMRDIIYNYTGIKTNLMRFPGGGSNTISRDYCPGIMSELTKDVQACGFKYFDWNVSSGDAGGTESTSQVVQNVISGVKKHDVSVVLQHDIKNFSVNAVEEIIVWGLSNGYTFLPLDETSPTMHHRVNN